jgi:hypothetical protein
VGVGGCVGVMVIVCTWPVTVCTVVTGVGDQLVLDDEDDEDEDGAIVVVLIRVVDLTSG